MQKIVKINFYTELVAPNHCYEDHKCSPSIHQMLNRRSNSSTSKGLEQDSANNSTPLCYSKNNRRFMNYLCMNLLKWTPSYLTRVGVKYLYSTWYSTRGRVTRPQSTNFTIRLRLDLGHRLLVIAF